MHKNVIKLVDTNKKKNCFRDFFASRDPINYKLGNDSPMIHENSKIMPIDCASISMMGKQNCKNKNKSYSHR